MDTFLYHESQTLTHIINIVINPALWTDFLSVACTVIN